MKFKYFLGVLLLSGILFPCQGKKEESAPEAQTQEAKKEFEFLSEQFADIKILRYQIPGFDELSLQQKKYVYYLTQAGLSGRDIMYDQNYRHNLKIRRALEKVYATYDGDKDSDDWKSFEVYMKQVWFANGIHHHYSNDKFSPKFSKDYLNGLLEQTGVTLEGDALEVIFNDTKIDQKDIRWIRYI